MIEKAHSEFSYGLKENEEKNYIRLSPDAGIESSAVREILSITQGRPEIISLAGGIPDTNLFPVHRYLEILKDFTKGRVKDYNGKEIKPGNLYQYSPTEGVPFFVETIKQWIEEKEDFGVETEQILTTSAAQAALDIAARALINPYKESTVIVGSPTYLAELMVLSGRFKHLEIIGMPLDENGMQVELIWDIPREKLEKCKYIYVVPTFDNPAGTELSEKRRKELIDISNEFGIPIIEDEPYQCLRYEGKKLHSIKHYDDIGSVLKIQSFSKMLAPGLRLGYIAGHKELIAKLRVILQATSLCSSSLSQYLVAEFMRRNYVEEYLNKVIPIYRERRDVMLKAMEEHLKDYGQWTKPNGGLFVWLRLNEINGDRFFEAAIKRNVAIVKGSAFFAPGADKKMHNSARLNFSKPQSEQIKKAIEGLGIACRDLSNIE